MSETPSIRIDADPKQRLDALAERSRRSKSFLAAEASTADLSTEQWQFEEIHSGIADLDAGDHVSHDEVQKWLGSWGKPSESNPPQ